MSKLGAEFVLGNSEASTREVLTADESQTSLSIRAQRRYTRRVGRVCKVFLRMIKMFYDNSGFEVFMTPQPPRDVERAVNNLVAGNTNLGWRLRCMVWVFYLLCAVQRHLPVVPRRALAQRPLDSECTPKEDARKPQMAAIDDWQAKSKGALY